MKHEDGKTHTGQADEAHQDTSGDHGGGRGEVLIVDEHGDPYPKGKNADENEKDHREEVIDRLRRFERWSIGLAFAVFFVTVAQFVFAVMNGRSSGKQADTLIAAADRATRAAESFSRSADRISGSMDQAVANLGVQSKAAQEANRATQQVYRANFIMWPVLDFPRRRITIGLKNAGKSVAVKVSAAGALDIDDVGRRIRGGGKYKHIPAAWPDVGNVQVDGTPGREIYFTIPDDFLAETLTPENTGHLVFFVRLTVKFDDGFGGMTTQHFCRAIVEDNSVNAGQLFAEMPECADAPTYIERRRVQIDSGGK